MGGARLEAATPGPVDMDASFDFHPSCAGRHWGAEAFWAKDRDSPVFEWPEDATGESYMDMRARARQNSAAGDYPDDMVVLYQFWSHFLVRHFNTRMFLEFRHLAVEDKVERGVLDGMQSLVKYYNAALLFHVPMRDIVLTHLLQLIETEKESDGQMPIFTILRSAWRNRTLNPVTREKLLDSAEAELIATLDP
jgi:la-related protein 1